jgi:hypothetical protein
MGSVSSVGIELCVELRQDLPHDEKFSQPDFASWCV